MSSLSQFSRRCTSAPGYRTYPFDIEAPHYTGSGDRFITVSIVFPYAFLEGMSIAGVRMPRERNRDDPEKRNAGQALT